jgi:predicted HicB family RNase H-like nuclease
VSTFVLRKIDPELWKLVKSKAALEGISLKALFLRLLTEYAKPEAGPNGNGHKQPA